MKKVLSLMVVIALLVCGIATVSAEISPSPTIPEGYIKIDVIPFPDDAGNAESDEKGYIDVNSDEYVTLTANAKQGYKFSHWEFITGQYVIIDGKLDTSVLVIDPKGEDNLLVYAHFVEKGADVTTPTEKPSLPADDDDKSPTTGYSALAVATSTVVIMAAFAVVVTLKKKQQG